MIYSIFGKLTRKTLDFIVIEFGGVGYKIFVSKNAFAELPKNNSNIKIFCFHRIKQEEIPELYGFLTEKELEIFELLISINGVGPKSALSILSAVKIDQFLAAIGQGRGDLMADSWGIGKKKAEKIIMELKDKIKKSKTQTDLSFIEVDNDLKSALKNLGYEKKEIDKALDQISEKIKKTEERLKEALKFLNGK